MAKPRIITKTVKRLRLHSAWLREQHADDSDLREREKFQRAANDVEEWADELNTYHGGSANLDPSRKAKRKTKKAKTKRVR